MAKDVRHLQSHGMEKTHTHTHTPHHEVLIAVWFIQTAARLPRKDAIPAEAKGMTLLSVLVPGPALSTQVSKKRHGPVSLLAPGSAPKLAPVLLGPLLQGALIETRNLNQCKTGPQQGLLTCAGLFPSGPREGDRQQPSISHPLSILDSY